MQLFFKKYKRLLLLVLGLFLITFLVGCNDGGQIDEEDKGSEKEVNYLLNVMSYNMKFEKQTGGGDPIYTWANRKPGIVKSLNDYDVTIVGTQELEGWQYDELMSDLGEKWSGVGEPRFLANDERSSILYRNDLVEYIEGETIWLSETPNVKGSKSWDTALPRILTYGKFKHLSSGVEFYFFNTHLDHKSALARKNGITLIVEYMDKYSEYPIILTGDFNMYIDNTDFDSLTSKSDIYIDTFSPFEPKFDVHGKTSHGFNGGTEGKPIDFIFYSKNDFDLLDTIIVHDKYEERFYLSDHYPVYSKFEFKND